MTAKNLDVTYACINYGDTYSTEEIKERSILINNDIGETLKELKQSETSDYMILNTGNRTDIPDFIVNGS